MSKVIVFEEARKRITDGRSLTEMLKKAVLLRGQGGFPQNGELISMTPKQFEKFIAGQMFSTLTSERNRISRESLACISYVSDLFRRMLEEVEIKSWHVTDYIFLYQKKKDLIFLKEGADVCFFRYSVFPKREDPKNQTLCEFGSSLYYHFYSQSKEFIALQMGKGFDFFGSIARQSISSLKVQ